MLRATRIALHRAISLRQHGALVRLFSYTGDTALGVMTTDRSWFRLELFRSSVARVLRRARKWPSRRLRRVWTLDWPESYISYTQPTTARPDHRITALRQTRRTEARRREPSEVWRWVKPPLHRDTDILAVFYRS